MTRPRAAVEQALVLHRLGLNAYAIARAMEIPRSTIAEWIRDRDRDRAVRVRSVDCFRCNGAEAPGSDYVYLLGLYLGDGCLSGNRKGVWRLRIFQDARYLGLINECRLAMAVVTPTKVALVRRIGCVEIGAGWKHWIHLFPQHGPGMKWLRRIVLEPWQQALKLEYPAQFLRGLIHSDGCRSINTIRRQWPGGHGEYAYPRYFFSNASDDIRGMFVDTCDELGLRWTQTNERNIAIWRRADVALLDRFIGPKA